MNRLPSSRPSPRFSLDQLPRLPMSPAEEQSGWGWRSLARHLGQRSGQCGLALLGFLLGQQPFAADRQPRVRWRRDRQGRSFYEVYDPVDGQRHRFATMTETRIWLENRYYR